MKKIISVLIVIAILAAMIIPVAAEEAAAPEEAEFVRFTATGNDPYATFYFSSEGNNEEIDPDEVMWAAVRYRTISRYDTTGVEFTGQFYVSPAAEPFIPITYVHSGQWETAIVDLTAVSDSTDLDSKWDSISYPNKNRIRFDPLEPDRDAEDTSMDEDLGQVKDGDCIDIAWIAFFETKEAAEAYTGKENTPYCILDTDSLSTLNEAYHITAEVLGAGDEVPTPEPPPEPTEVPEEPTDDPENPAENPGEATDKPEPEYFYLYDSSSGTNRGWWMHPIVEDSRIVVEFSSDVPFTGLWFFAFCCEVAVPMYVDILDAATEEVLWINTEPIMCKSNAGNTVDFGITIAPGDYILEFIGGDVTEFTSQDTWFVLGSCEPDENLEVLVSGGLTNEETLEAPAVYLFVGDMADVPTKAPTATPAPTAEPTPAPTAVPTEEPQPEATEKAEENEQTKGLSKGAVIGIIAGAVVAAAAVVAIVISAAKKKKA